MILNTTHNKLVKMAGRFGKKDVELLVCIKNGILTNKIFDRSFLGKAILEPLDKINMNDKHSTNMLY